MRKIFSIILVLLIMLLSSILPVCAEYIYNNPFGFLYVDEYIKQYGPVMSYTELYYHKEFEDDSKENIDWALVRAYSLKDEFTNYLNFCAVIGDRVLITSGCVDPFLMEYAVYDIRENAFIDISDVNIKNYNGLQECLEVLEIGLPIGDVDYDGELTIVDATEIQRVMANLSAFKESDIIKADILSEDKLVFISDFNRDGERTILDATGIQMKLAKVEG